MKIPMSPAEFDTIKQALEHADPQEHIEVHFVDATKRTHGSIFGHEPLKWSADFSFDGTDLTVLGHGIFSGKIEKRISERLMPALAKMRAPDVVRAV